MQPREQSEQRRPPPAPLRSSRRSAAARRGPGRRPRARTRRGRSRRAPARRRCARSTPTRRCRAPVQTANATSAPTADPRGPGDATGGQHPDERSEQHDPPDRDADLAADDRVVAAALAGRGRGPGRTASPFPRGSARTQPAAPCSHGTSRQLTSVGALLRDCFSAGRHADSTYGPTASRLTSACQPGIAWTVSPNMSRVPLIVLASVVMAAFPAAAAAQDNSAIDEYLESVPSGGGDIRATAPAGAAGAPTVAPAAPARAPAVDRRAASRFLRPTPRRSESQGAAGAAAAGLAEATAPSQSSQPGAGRSRRRLRRQRRRPAAPAASPATAAAAPARGSQT